MKIVAPLFFGVALLFASGLEVFAQTSCSAWHSSCVARCKATGAAQCIYCARQLALCKDTGCFTEHANFGGKQHCKLAK